MDQNEHRRNQLRFRDWNVNRAIERGAVRSERATVAFVALLVLLLALVIIVYTITKPEMM